MISTTTTDWWANRRVLVTGSCGFIGAHLVHGLMQADAQVLGIDRGHDSSAAPAGRPAAVPNAGLLSIDLADAEEVFSVFADFRPQYVFHLASAADGKEDFAQVNRSIHGGLVLTVNLLEAFQRYPGQLFVFGDSSKTYGDPGVGYRESLPDDPLSSYAIAKSTGWQFCKYYRRLYDTDVVSIRPTLVYGPGQPTNVISYVIENALRGASEIPLLGGRQTRDPLHISDLVRAYLSLASRRERVSGRVINLGGGREIAIADLAQLITDLCGAEAQIKVDDSQTRPTDSQRSFSSNDEANELLGWSPAVELATGLNDLIARLASAHSLSGGRLMMP